MIETRIQPSDGWISSSAFSQQNKTKQNKTRLIWRSDSSLHGNLSLKFVVLSFLYIVVAYTTFNHKNSM